MNQYKLIIIIYKLIFLFRVISNNAQWFNKVWRGEKSEKIGPKIRSHMWRQGIEILKRILFGDFWGNIILPQFLCMCTVIVSEPSSNFALGYLSFISHWFLRQTHEFISASHPPPAMDNYLWRPHFLVLWVGKPV